MTFFKPANSNRSLIRGIISIVIGVTVISVPDFSLKLMMQLLGAILMADGLIALLTDYFTSKKIKVYWIIPRGTSNLIIGIILVIFPALLVNIFVFVLGILLILAGGNQMLNQFSTGWKSGFSWILTLISIIALITGILLITKPFESARTVLMMFGVVLSVYGIGEIMWSFKIRKLQKAENKQVTDTKYEEVE